VSFHRRVPYDMDATRLCMITRVLITLVQAAAALEKFSLDSPKKAVQPESPVLRSSKLPIDDERLPESPKSAEGDEEAELDELRTKFVGEIDLPESTSHCLRTRHQMLTRRA
jgi:hypothetical protein